MASFGVNSFLKKYTDEKKRALLSYCSGKKKIYVMAEKMVNIICTLR